MHQAGTVALEGGALGGVDPLRRLGHDAGAVRVVVEVLDVHRADTTGARRRPLRGWDPRPATEAAGAPGGVSRS
ncbi:hypothetical protein GCM10009737_34520 [Nocardioides lentus]|uniref:Uncharacterized protein n=1 Tax=Nocardioides lentus TaxID=338077 RepID=A0ABN2PR59_9ACTN